MRIGGRIMKLPHPDEIFARFERGEINREGLHALMARHARLLIEEMEEDYHNPLAAWWEGLLARRAMRRLLARHGSTLMREVLVALAEADFPGSGFLWNAGHADVPLHCFLRMKRSPVFRILSLRVQGSGLVVTVETGSDEGSEVVVRRAFMLARDRQWLLRCSKDPANKKGG